jgi:hypothetical protein
MKGSAGYHGRLLVKKVDLKADTVSCTGYNGVILIYLAD